jgi:hypothetical protein
MDILENSSEILDVHPSIPVEASHLSLQLPDSQSWLVLAGSLRPFVLAPYWLTWLLCLPTQAIQVQTQALPLISLSTVRNSQIV